MSNFCDYEITSLKELQDTFLANLSNQEQYSYYPVSFIPIRSKLITWLMRICDKIIFKPETIHRTITLFDLLISLNKTNSDQIDMNELKLFFVGCLSIATKLNEFNANFTKFLTDQVLNTSSINQTNAQLYSYLDLSYIEMLIPNLVQYNVNSANVYHFNSIFVRICLMDIQQDEMKELFLDLNNKIMTSFLFSEHMLNLSPVNSAIMVLNETIKHFPQEKMNITFNVIIEKIQKLLWSKRNTNDNDTNTNDDSTSKCIMKDKTIVY